MKKERVYNTQIKKIPLQFVASSKKVALEALVEYIEFLGDDLFEEEEDWKWKQRLFTMPKE